MEISGQYHIFSGDGAAEPRKKFYQSALFSVPNLIKDISTFYMWNPFCRIPYKESSAIFWSGFSRITVETSANRFKV